MATILIPLVGMLDVDPELVAMSGMVVIGKTQLVKDIPVDLEVWKYWIAQKRAGRYRSMNDLFRVEFLGKAPNNPLVKNYSDESDQIADSSS